MESILPCLHRAFIWLSRFRYRKGYGVQSPFAFGLICEVINGSGEYYAFADLLEERRALKRVQRARLKKDKMLFRLANFVQPSLLIVPRRVEVSTRRYMEAGCRSAAVQCYGGAAALRSVLAAAAGRRMLLGVGASEDAEAEVAAALPLMRAGSVMVVDGICRGRTMRELWSHIVADNRCILTFDLYDVGLVFFDSKYVKQNYKVNF